MVGVEKLVDQTRLPYARLSDDGNDLAAPCPGSLQYLL
jgi:hypothetical protein